MALGLAAALLAENSLCVSLKDMASMTQGATGRMKNCEVKSCWME